MATVIKTTFQLRRGNASVWAKNNPILERGEPGFVIDENRLKIGDGATAWNNLPYVGEDNVYNVSFSSEFPAIGRANVIYKAENEKILYQWNSSIQKYEPLTSGESIEIEGLKEDVEALQEVVEELPKSFLTKEDAPQFIANNKYEVFSYPEETLVRITDEEIRIMCPSDTLWKWQQSGQNADPNSYYIGLKIYAPSGEIYSFKEDLAEVIADQTMYYFENNEFAGIDENNRKFSIIWLPVAHYDESLDEWEYHGKNSTTKKYLGWNYSVEWYDEAGLKVGSDCIRINLSNETCHNIVEPYYMGSININKLTQNDNDVLILYGGSASDNI